MPKTLTTFPQYAITDHPDVIAAIERSYELDREFGQAVADLAEELTDDRQAGFAAGAMFEGFHMVGIAKQYVDLLPGRWKKPTGGSVSPYRVNPRECSTLQGEGASCPNLLTDVTEVCRTLS